jgi:hypothetical protein
MSIHRYATRVDTTQSAIVEALRKAGWTVTQLKWPVDLLCDKHGVIRLLEVKVPVGKRAPKPRLDKRQAAQAEFCARTNTPYVTTPEEALRALGELL